MNEEDAEAVMGIGVALGQLKGRIIQLEKDAAAAVKHHESLRAERDNAVNAVMEAKNETGLVAKKNLETINTLKAEAVAADSYVKTLEEDITQLRKALKEWETIGYVVRHTWKSYKIVEQSEIDGINELLKDKKPT